ECSRHHRAVQDRCVCDCLCSSYFYCPADSELKASHLRRQSGRRRSASSLAPCFPFESCRLNPQNSSESRQRPPGPSPFSSRSVQDGTKGRPPLERSC